MIDFTTLILISTLNELAEMTKNGIYPFSLATKEQEDAVLYDDENDKNPVLADYLIDEEHHDMISTYSQLFENEGVNINVVVEAKDNSYINVTFRDIEMSIVIEKGKWYCA